MCFVYCTTATTLLQKKIVHDSFFAQSIFSDADDDTTTYILTIIFKVNDNLCKFSSYVCCNIANVSTFKCVVFNLKYFQIRTYFFLLKQFSAISTYYMLCTLTQMKKVI